jgi:hypothetical protein
VNAITLRIAARHFADGFRTRNRTRQDRLTAHGRWIFSSCAPSRTGEGGTSTIVADRRARSVGEQAEDVGGVAGPSV